MVRRKKRKYARAKAGLDNAAIAYQVRFVSEVADAINHAAAENYELPVQWIRRVIVERLKNDGALSF